MINFKLNKKIIFVISIILLFIIVAVLTINKSNYTPTVINTIPKNKSNEIIETSQIEIIFKDDLGEKNKPNISIEPVPFFEYDSVWNKNILKIIPKANLDNNKKYKITINYKNKKIYELLFETSIFSLSYIQKNRIQATEDDLLYGEALKKIIEKYPWYPSLPIKTQNYVVYYDFESDKFAITFLKEITNQKDIETQVKDALVRIKQIGAKEPIQYYINK